MGTDALLATYVCEKTAEELNRRGKPCLVSPAITVGNATHHMSFPGSMTLKPQTYLAMLQDYCESLAAHGFRKIVIVNGHGGNVAPTQTALININEALGFLSISLATTKATPKPNRIFWKPRPIWTTPAKAKLP